MPAPDPRANPILLGHDAAEATILDAIQAGRMHHAWLIQGPEGVGKATLAYRFARRLLAGQGGRTLDLPETDPVFRRVAAASHADMLTVEREYDTKRRRMRSQIAVDDVRKINGFMSLTAAEGGWRVVVVDGAEDMNPASANAILKVLEEPPPRAVLILVCSAPGRLLPTIRSRCRRLRLSALDDATMHTLLRRYLPDLADDQRERLVAMSEGSPGRALAMAEDEGLAIAMVVDNVLSSLPDIPVSKQYDIADQLVRVETGFATFMDMLRTGVAAAVRAVARGQGDPDQERMVALRPIEAWTEVWHALTRLQDDTEHANLDKRQAIVAGLGLLTGQAT